MDYEKEISFGAFDSELMRQEIYIPEGFEATIEGNKIILKKTESEDERVRKSIIGFLKTISSLKNGKTVSNEDFDSTELLKWVVWLEKQGEHANFRNKIQIGDKVTRNKDGVLVNLSQLKRVAKPSEQKPMDKVEPKFHEGDWIVNKFGDVWHIDSFDNKNYQVSNGNEYNYFPISKQNEMNLWTIQDAKDGDVIYFNNDISGFHSIGLFKRLASKNEINGGTYRCYARYGGFNEESKLEIAQNNNELHHFGTKAYPATKEQRDTLMKAMTDAGWKFDFKKKELMKIEKNTDVNHEYFSELLENDDSKDINDYAYQVAYCISHDWLKETATWDDVEKACKLGAEWKEKQYNSLTNWSKEDEQIKEDILYDLNTLLEDSKSEWAIKDLKKEINWVESLKLQNYWKPSDEQMEALKQAKTDACGKPYFNALASLYVDLH